MNTEVKAAGQGWRVGVRAAPFRRISAAWLVSTVGDGVRMAALPLYAAVSTRDPVAVSVVAAAEVLPWLIVAPFAGAVVDRSRPRRVVFTAHAVRAVVLAALAAAVVTHHAGIAVLATVALVLTTLETFADAAAQLLLVELAGDPELDAANSRFIAIQTTGENLLGPLLAGVLFAWHPATCFALDAVSFAVASGLIRSLPDAAPQRSPDASTRPLRQRLAEGIRFLLTQPALRAQLIVVAVGAAAAGVMNALLALYALQALGMRAPLVPTLWVALAIAGLVGARAAPRLARRFTDGPVMVTALLVAAGGFVLLGVAGQPPAAYVACAAVGLGTGCWNVLSTTRRQRLTPRAMLGRLAGVYQMLAWGLLPLGSAVAGPLAAQSSMGAVLVGAGITVAAVLLLCSRSLVRQATARH